MRQHIRTDTFKVYSKEDKILQSIIEEKKLSAKQGKSEAYRIALHSYEEHHNIPKAVESLKESLAEILEEQKQSYFVTQALVATIEELRLVISSLAKQ